MRHGGSRQGDRRDGHKGKHERNDQRSFDAGWSERKRPRAQRGDVRTAILLLVAEEAQHGYQIMQAMSARSAGVWNPSPGAVYPMITQLEQEGLVHVDDEGGRRVVSITPAGREHLELLTRQRSDPFVEFQDAGSRGSSAEPPLAQPARALQLAVDQVELTGSPAQIAAAEEVLAQARRSLYRILAEDTH